MLKLGDDFCFPFEPQTKLWIGMKQLAWQDFDGDLAFEPGSYAR